MQGEDCREPVADEYGRDDLRGEAAVRLAHPLERGVGEGGRAVGLDDLAALQQLVDDRLVAKIDRPLVGKGRHPVGERLVRDGERVVAGQILA